MSVESVVHYLNLNRVPEDDPDDQIEWLLTAMGRFTGTELRELLYVAEEPGFFEFIRAFYALPEESRSALQKSLGSDQRALPVRAATGSKDWLTPDRVGFEPRFTVFPGCKSETS